MVSKNAKLQLCTWGEMSLEGFGNSFNYLNGMFFSQISPRLFLWSPSSFCSNVTLSVKPFLTVLLKIAIWPPPQAPLPKITPFSAGPQRAIFAYQHSSPIPKHQQSEILYISLASFPPALRVQFSFGWLLELKVPRTMLSTEEVLNKYLWTSTFTNCNLF